MPEKAHIVSIYVGHLSQQKSGKWIYELKSTLAEIDHKKFNPDLLV